jgi:DNA-binding protein HU-beta
MNKNELAVEMSLHTDLTKEQVLNYIDIMIDSITGELKKKDGKLTLVGFGTLKTIVKKRKRGRNPRTGEEIIIPKRRSVKFVPGKNLKELVE